MNAKHIIQLFVPPVCGKVWRKLMKKPVTAPLPLEKHVFYQYFSEMNRRAMLPFTALEALSKDIPFYNVSSITLDNAEPNFYGSYYALQTYAGLPLLNLPPKGLAVQHGYVFEMLTWEKEKLEQINFVWSKAVYDMYRKLTDNPNIYAIGAPFFYAKSLLSVEEIAQEKKRLGKNLLAFPMHSSHFVQTKYDPALFLKVLEQEKTKFDTVRVCLYWKDILNGGAEIYLKAGYECVCSGHIFDPCFLMRQRALFEIADATISNGVGSHIGYSVYLNKPHWLIPDKYDFVDIEGTDGTELMHAHQTQNYWDVHNAFLNNEVYQITEEQVSVVDRLWGVSDKKNPNELRELLQSLY